MPGERTFEVVIVGGGIAGASLAYFLTERGMTDVLLLERETQPGYHSTGRSAAVAVEWDPIPALQELKVQGAAFLRNPPPGFAEHVLLEPSGILVVFQEPLWSGVRQVVPRLTERGTAVQVLARAEVIARVPVLAPEYVDGGVLLPEDGHIDVHELLWSYLRHAARRGAERRCGVEVHGVRSAGGRVHTVVTSAGEFGARWVVNAAGGWAGAIAARAWRRRASRAWRERALIRRNSFTTVLHHSRVRSSFAVVRSMTSQFQHRRSARARSGRSAFVFRS